MTALVLDVENTTTTRNGKLHLDPFEEGNTLTMVGTRVVDTGETHLLVFDHAENVDGDQGAASIIVQQQLDAATLLIMHNAQHDLMWLWECGFKYDGDIYDTMLGEYILARGITMPLSLDACAQRRKLSIQKQDTLKEYFKKGYTTREIPLAELSEYLDADLGTTAELYLDQQQDYLKPESMSLHRVRNTTMQVCKTLTRMYCAGVKIDTDALQAVKKLYETEQAQIIERLTQYTRELMGDTPINLNSPEQMSQVVFSRAPLNKKEWPDLFKHTKTQKEFKQAVKMNSRVIFKTEAYICPTCKGEKYVHKIKKDGKPFAKPSKCKDCDAEGYKLRQTSEVAGLKFLPSSESWVTANGFGTSKDNLSVLITVARQNDMKKAIDFLTDMQRLSAVSNYLSTFVGGINNYMKPNTSMLHVGLTQHITATGRFSGRNPNMQNMPRGGTFPIKKAFVSRWEGGQIMEADFAQLEFRVAAFLAQDAVAMHEVSTGFDVHSYTAQIITEAGQQTKRQEAKAHTFAPLYGATGHGRTKAEAAYYHHFIEKYEGIAAWHKVLGDEAIRFLKITTPSGRQYAFPDVYRRKNGSVSDFTRIKNYPVQGFATADVVPVILMEIERLLMPYNSMIVNTVHDSIVLDVHPDETEIVIGIIKDVDARLVKLIEEAYDVSINVPMLLESKIGPNWLDTKDVA
jgi:DNA polymerase-1